MSTLIGVRRSFSTLTRRLPRHAPQHLWDEARESIADGETVNGAAKRLGINRSALRKRIKKEAWTILTEDEKA